DAESGAGAPRVDALGSGAIDIAVGLDGQREAAVVIRVNAGGATADRRARGGGHPEIGATGGIVCLDGSVIGAGDIAVGGDGQRARAEVDRKNAAVVAVDRSAGAAGHRKSGAGVPRVDAATVGAGDIAVGGDGERT